MRTPSPTFHRKQQKPCQWNTARSIAFPALTVLLALAWLAAAVPAAMAQATRYAFSNYAGLVGGPGSVDATGSAARFNYPSGTAVDAAGNTYVADTGNHTIRKITPAGVVTTFAGSANKSGSIDAPAGPATSARFNNPQGVALDSTGANLYVADTGSHTIRKIVVATGAVTTLAGGAGSSGSADAPAGPGSLARFYLPAGLAVDATGNIYVADTRNYTIRKIVAATGAVTTLAGSAGNLGSTDAPAGPGGVARFSSPEGLAVDAAGANIYVADTGNHTIRRIVAATGFVSTVAGTAGTPGSADAPAGPATAALFNGAQGVVVDSAGANIYVADTGNHTIRQIVVGTGVVSTLAGTAGVSGAADPAGTATGAAAEFYHPNGLALDSTGTNLYVADTFNLTVRKVTTAAGATTTLAGLSAGTGIADGSGTAARFNNPQSVASDSAGNSYVADTGNHTIRMITPAGAVTTLAGTAGTFGSTDAIGTAATFNSPAAVAVDAAGTTVYVADTGNHTIRTVDVASGTVATLAGLAGSSGSTNGSGAAARFNSPQGVAVDSAGNVYVGDTANHLIRKVTSGGVVSTFTGTVGSAGGRDGVPVAATGTASGSMTNGAVYPVGSTYIGTSTADGSGTILAGDVVRFAGDPNNYVVAVGTANVRGGTAAGAATTAVGFAIGTTYIATNGTSGTGSILAGDIVTFAGDTTAYRVATGTADVTGGGTGSFITLVSPGLTKVIGTSNTAITVIGSSINLAGSGLVQAIPGGKTPITVISAAQFNNPQGLAVDVSGNVYVADAHNNTIRKVSPAGVVATVAGMAGTSGSTDGTGFAALFKNPKSVALDASGNIYVADVGNYTIRKISPQGVVVTIGGQPGILGSADGAGFAARFYNPSGISLDASNNIYVADAHNNRISRGTPFPFFPKKSNTDLNGDGSDDLVFQNNVGQVAVWYMNGGGALNSSAYIYGAALAGWRVVGVVDMNNDGHADIVLQHPLGPVFVWYLDGNGVITSGGFIYAGGLGDWQVVGVADMDGDGNADVLFQNTVGQIAVWYMDGSGSATSSAYIYAGGLGDWRVVGVADMNNDNNADILFQNSANSVAVWYMDGHGALSSTAVIYPGALPGWRVVATADMNDDGNTDIILQSTVGQVFVWYMTGTGTIAAGAFIYNGALGDWRVR